MTTRGRSLGAQEAYAAAELAERQELREELRIADEERPRTRGECTLVPRPCSFVSCRYNLYTDRTSGGAVKLNFPHLLPGDMPADGSCALDVAERGGITLEEVGDLLGLVRSSGPARFSGARLPR